LSSRSVELTDMDNVEFRKTRHYHKFVKSVYTYATTTIVTAQIVSQQHHAITTIHSYTGHISTNVNHEKSKYTRK